MALHVLYSHICLSSRAVCTQAIWQIFPQWTNLKFSFASWILLKIQLLELCPAVCCCLAHSGSLRSRMWECVLWGLRTGLGHHALVEHLGWVDWFSMPQNVSREVYDVFSFMKSGKLMWLLSEKSGFLHLSSVQIHVVNGSYWGCSAGSLWPARQEGVLSKTNILFSVQFPQF